MTAEIAILNREAVTLAADSAVTMRKEKGEKIFTSANKLFTLSKYYPVGIMVYGNANFMYVPWETIIKIYRRNLGKRNFNTLNEYATNFIDFLDNGNLIFTEQMQKRYLYWTTVYFYYQIIFQFVKEMKLIIKKEVKIKDTLIKQTISKVVKEHHDKLKDRKTLPTIPKTHSKNIITKYAKIIDDAIEDVFKKLPITASSLNQLRKISADLFSKDIPLYDTSGIVIAGFGEKDIFPSISSFDVDGIVNNKLKYKYNENKSGEISINTTALIIPFAQREMVYSFMEGIDPDLENHMLRELFLQFNEYTKFFVENIGKFDDRKKQALFKKLEQKRDNIFKDYIDDLKKYTKKYHWKPIINVVTMLPKNELAMMAETLVNLTAFKRKVTEKSETAAPPIDVALISKGDGFIWVKRKHYFKPELNKQFFANYYKEAENEKKQRKSL